MNQNIAKLPIEILNVELENGFKVSIEIYWPFLVLIFLILLVFWLFRNKQKNFGLVELEIALGGIGKAKIKPNYVDVQIAHKMWVELVTRKAAIKIEPEKDVIIEVYNSWYLLFKRNRELIADIPAELIRNNESTRKLIDIATKSLNEGLRPHLTEWQAKFRNWYEHQSESLKIKTPQETQKNFPEYNSLIADMKRVNEQLIDYAIELKKISEGR